MMSIEYRDISGLCLLPRFRSCFEEAVDYAVVSFGLKDYLIIQRKGLHMVKADSSSCETITQIKEKYEEATWC